MTATDADVEAVGLIARIIFVQVDNTLFAPEHSSIQRAANAIVQKIRALGWTPPHSSIQRAAAPEGG